METAAQKTSHTVDFFFLRVTTGLPVTIFRRNDKAAQVNRTNQPSAIEVRLYTNPLISKALRRHFSFQSRPPAHVGGVRSYRHRIDSLNTPKIRDYSHNRDTILDGSGSYDNIFIDL